LKHPRKIFENDAHSQNFFGNFFALENVKKIHTKAITMLSVDEQG